MPLLTKMRPRYRVYWNNLFIGIVVALLTTSCGTTLKQVHISDEAVKIEREKQEDIAFSRFMDKQNRLYSISYPMLVASGELFTDKVRPTYGFILHDKELYREILGKEYENVAVRHGIEEHVTVRYVYPESPADSADLRVGDCILAINEKPLEEENAIDVMQILHKLEYPEERSLELLIEREGQKIKLTINGVAACKYSIQMVNNDSVNAFASFEGVFITTGMIRFCESDKELALVVGHEIAHIALGHITKGIINRIPGMILDAIIVATIGVDTQGALGALASLVFSKAFELEADYAGLYILARADYDITGAAAFFRRMAVEHPGSIRGNFLATHPSMPERFVSIENTVREIEEKLQRGEPLIPEKKNNKEK
ncbi:MAG: M48 family metalloprotease [Planctomycetota bacterium]